MTRDVVTVGTDINICQVADILFQNSFHGLPVVEGKKVKGIITEDDFFLKNYDDLYLPAYLRFIKENKVADNLPDDIKEKIEALLSVKAKDLMTPNVLTVQPDMTIDKLMKLIKETKFTTFPVTDAEDNMVGIVSLSDILGTVKENSREMKKAFKGNEKIENLALELDHMWKDKFVLISKKKLHTWQSAVIIAFLTLTMSAILWIVTTNSKALNDLANSASQLECQRFSYTDWSSCRPDNTQVRDIKDKFPSDCQGGAPKLIQNCQ